MEYGGQMMKSAILHFCWNLESHHVDLVVQMNQDRYYYLLGEMPIFGLVSLHF